MNQQEPQTLVTLSRELSVYVVSVSQQEPVFRVEFGGDYSPYFYEPTEFVWAKLVAEAMDQVSKRLADSRYRFEVQRCDFSQKFLTSYGNSKSTVHFEITIKYLLKKSAPYTPPFRYPSH